MRPVCIHFLKGLAAHHTVRYMVGIIGVVCSYLVFLHRCIPPSTFEGFVDFPSFYAASIAVFQQHLSPYDLARLTRINGLEFRTFPFLYPPPSVILFQPLASLSFEDAKRTMTLFNHLLLVPTLVIIPSCALRLSRVRDFWRYALCLLYPLFLYPLIVSVRYGQINIALLTALVGFWIALLQNRSKCAALCLSIAIVCKTIPLLFLPMLIIIGRYRVSAYTTIFLTIACLLSYEILPHGMWSAWLFFIAPSGGYMNEPFGLFAPAGEWNQSLNGVLARALTQSLWSNPGFHSPLLGKILCYSGSLCIVTVSSALLYRARHSPLASHLIMAITLPTIFLIAPFSWEHHIVYLLPAILFTLSDQPAWSLPWRISLVVGSLITGLSFTIPALLFYRFASVVALWCIVCLITWKHGSDTTVVPPGKSSAG